MQYHILYIFTCCFNLPNAEHFCFSKSCKCGMHDIILSGWLQGNRAAAILDLNPNHIMYLFITANSLPLCSLFGCQVHTELWSLLLLSNNYQGHTFFMNKARTGCSEAAEPSENLVVSWGVSLLEASILCWPNLYVLWITGNIAKYVHGSFEYVKEFI